MGIRALINGNVQGVGYRRFAQSEANLLGVQGWTRNLKDGRVEVYAEGLPEVLEQFVERLKKGPRASRVNEVFVSSQEIPLSQKGFVIRYDE